MNKTSRFLAIAILLVFSLTALWSCDKENEQDTPEGTGIFLILNNSKHRLYYLKDEDPTDTLVIDSAQMVPIEVFVEEESHASPSEFYAGKKLLLYRIHEIDSVTLIPAYEQKPVINSLWIWDKKDDLEYGVSQYKIIISDNMIL